MEDFETVLSMEQEISKNGFDEGHSKGLVTGRLEGKSIGTDHGKKAAASFGREFGFSLVMCQFLDRKPHLSRAEQKAVAILNAIIANETKVKKYKNDAEGLNQIHKLLEKSKKQFEEARRYLKMKNERNDLDELSF